MISVIIPTLNESNAILNKTIESIIDTTPDKEIEIIVVDDCSDNPVILNSRIKNKVIFQENKFKVRLGAAQSKHIGVCLSSKKYIYLTDAHVLFEKGWYEEALKSLENHPETLWCGSCLGLSKDKFDLSKYNGKYTGADLFLYDEKDKNILDGKWTKEKLHENNYDISCVMGANYFMHKNWFFKIRGYGDLKAWGSEEPCISIKSWLAGGQVKINKNVRMGHMFRDSAPYITYSKDILYNKIRIAKTFFSNDLGNKLIQTLEYNPNFSDAMNMINQHQFIISEYKNYYTSLFTKNIEWLCQKFNIQIPN